MKVEFTQNAWEEFTYWIEREPTKGKRIINLLRSIKRTPFQGLGKPEPLKYELSGYWSRRIDQRPRLVYKIFGKKGEDFRCIIIQCKYHYD